MYISSRSEFVALLDFFELSNSVWPVGIVELTRELFIMFHGWFQSSIVGFC